MNYKQQYTAPTLTVVSFKSERGYAQSGLTSFRFVMSSALSGTPISVTSNQEQWDAPVNLFGDNNNNWDNN